MLSSTREALKILKAARVTLDKGLDTEELDRVEADFGFAFAPDHRDLLAAALPVGERWVDWRRADLSDISARLLWPQEGVLFDVEHNAFWPGSWGDRPAQLGAALERARERVSTWPRLVPVYGHRYLPAAPAPTGSPVFSVYQTDVIYYGNDLVDYLHHEFGRARAVHSTAAIVRIPVWSDLAEQDGRSC
ncbi:hypothetical protein [Thalassiella azotivora]